MKNLLSLFLVIIAGCTQTVPIEETDPQTLRASQEPTIVKVSKAEVKPFNFYIESNGIIEASSRSEVKFEQGGRLLEVNLKNGQKVRKGQLLAKLDDSEAQLALRKAEANLKSKQYTYKSEMLSYNEKELGSEQGKTIIESIKHSTGLADAEISYDEAEMRVSKTSVKAYISGTIANSQDLGQVYVNAGDKLCDIVNLSRLQVSTKVLENDLQKIKMGIQAEIIPLSNPQHKLTAKVTEINPVVGETGMVDIKLGLTNAKDVAPGMNVHVKLELTQEKTLVVPKEAVVIRSGREVVFVFENGLAKWHYITSGVTNGEEVEVIEGLEENMQVIIENNLQLAHDASIQIAH